LHQRNKAKEDYKVEVREKQYQMVMEGVTFNPVLNKNRNSMSSDRRQDTQARLVKPGHYGRDHIEKAADE